MDFILLIQAFVFGLIFGSFINCLIWRLKVNESLWNRSYCPKCRQAIAWHDNIPLLSFFILRAKCRHCHKKISWQYPLVELSFALLFSAVFFKLLNTFSINDLMSFEFIVAFLRDFIFIFTLTVVFVYDFKWQEVPMLIVWPAIFLMMLFSFLSGASLLNIIIASAMGALFFYLQYFLTKGRGIGEGDIWLGALLGARLLTFSAISLSIFSAYIIGSLIAIILLLQAKAGLKSKMAFGPFLVIGALISLFFSEPIISWYLSLILF